MVKTLILYKNEAYDGEFNDIDLKITDYDNSLNVYVDDKSNYFFNLNTALNIDADQILKEYRCTHDSHWTLLSYNIYSTPRLAWLLMKVNKVKPNEIFKCIEAGSKVKYIPAELLRTIITTILNYGR